MVKQGWGDHGSPWNPLPHLARRRDVLLIEARGGLPATEVCHKPPYQIVFEFGAVVHLDKEAVIDRVERLRDVHRYGCYYSARRLTLTETRNHPSINGKHSEAGECLGLKPCWEGRVHNVSTLEGRRSRSTCHFLQGPGFCSTSPLRSSRATSQSAGGRRLGTEKTLDLGPPFGGQGGVVVICPTSPTSYSNT